MKTIFIILSITCLAMLPSTFSRIIRVQSQPKLKAAEDLISIATDVFNEKASAVIDAKSEMISIVADAAAKKGKALLKAGSRIKSAVLKGALGGISVIGNKLIQKVGFLSSGGAGIGGSVDVRPPGGDINVVVDNKPTPKKQDSLEMKSSELLVNKD